MGAGGGRTCTAVAAVPSTGFARRHASTRLLGSPPAPPPTISLALTLSVGIALNNTSLHPSSAAGPRLTHHPPTHLMCSNAMNALSEDNSLLQMPVWRNPWLLVAMAVSLGLHAVILYVPLLAGGWLGGWLAGWRAPAGWLAFVLAWLAWAVLKEPARSGHGWNLL